MLEYYFPVGETFFFSGTMLVSGRVDLRGLKDWGNQRGGGCKLSRWWFQTFFYVHPYLGKIPILTNIFQMGWTTNQLCLILPFDSSKIPWFPIWRYTVSFIWVVKKFFSHHLQGGSLPVLSGPTRKAIHRGPITLMIARAHRSKQLL